MVATVPRFPFRVLDPLVKRLLIRLASDTRSVDALRDDVAGSLSQCDTSDLLDDDAPSTDSNTTTTLMLVQRVEGRLWEVEAALDRVAEDTYGCCIGCASSIPLIRLQALPATAWCFDCSHQSSQQEGNVFDREYLRSKRIKERSMAG